MTVKRYIWTHFIAISVILLIGIAFALPVKQTNAVMFQSTETPDPTSENTLQSRLELSEIDMSCQSNCWSNFVFNETGMDMVYNWFDEEFAVTNFQHNNDSPNNIVGVNIGGNFEILAFSDNQQPPLLRAVVVRINPTNNPDLSNGVGAISPEHTQFLLPANILENIEHKPSQLMITIESNFYQIVIDFSDIGIAFGYSGRIVNNDMCFNQPIDRILWLSYGNNEISGIRLLNELGQYEGMTNSSFFNNSKEKIILLSNDDEIYQIIEQLSNSECLNLQPYGLIEQ